jgi:hypothetical protein
MTPAQQAIDGATIALCAHRMTRLVTSDEVWAATRIRLRNRLRRHGTAQSLIVLTEKPDVIGKRYTPRSFVPGKIADALACPLCAGVWITGAITAAWHYGGPRTHAAIRAGALMGVQSILATRT